jgi:hypothetical protein
LFDAAERQAEVFSSTIPRAADSPPVQMPWAGREILHDFLSWYLFPYVKFFNPYLADDDPVNFYMEREWRVVGAVPFCLVDIERLLVPKEFAGRLRTDLSEYSGQTTFTHL